MARAFADVGWPQTETRIDLVQPDVRRSVRRRVRRGVDSERVAPTLAAITHATASHWRAEQVLVHDDDAGQRRGRGLEAHQDAEDRRPDRAQRGELARVGDHRAQQPDERAERRSRAGRRARVPRTSTRNGAISTVATTLATVSPSRPGQRRPVDALSRMYAVHDAAASSANATPAAFRSARSMPSRPTPTAASPTQTRSRGRRLPATASAERPEELDGHRDPQRDPGERLVDRPVHRPEDDAERDRHPPVVRRTPAERGRATTIPSTTALVASRSQTRVIGAASSNRFLAIAAPSCTETMPTTTSHTGGILDSTPATYRPPTRRWCRVPTGVLTPSPLRRLGVALRRLFAPSRRPVAPSLCADSAVSGGRRTRGSPRRGLGDTGSGAEVDRVPAGPVEEAGAVAEQDRGRSGPGSRPAARPRGTRGRPRRRGC